MTFSDIQSSKPLSSLSDYDPIDVFLVDELRALKSQPPPIVPPLCLAALGTKPLEMFVFLGGGGFGLKLLKFSNFVRISMA